MRTPRLTGVLVAAGLIFGTSVARAQVLNFEAAGDPIPDGYGGFDWDPNFGAFSAMLFDGCSNAFGGFGGTGFCYPSSGTYVAYNRYAITTVELAQGPSFIFNSVYLSSGYSDGLSLTIEGFLGANPVALFSQAFVLNMGPGAVHTFNWAGIDRLKFTTVDGIDANQNDHFQGPYFVMDDFTYNQAFVVTTPEPATLGLFASGLVGLAGAGYLRRRRQQ